MDEQNDFFVTGRVIDYLQYKSFIDDKDTCVGSIQSKLDVDFSQGKKSKSNNDKEHFRAGFCDSDRNGY